MLAIGTCDKLAGGTRVLAIGAVAVGTAGGTRVLAIGAVTAGGSRVHWCSNSWDSSSVEALTVHNRYCDGCMVQPALPIQAATLLHQQKSLLEHQMRLMNQQILKYRVWQDMWCVSVHVTWLVLCWHL